MEGALSFAASREGGLAARLRIIACYAWRHRRLPDLDAPTRFTEFVQLRKLTGRDLQMAALSDKVTAKILVRDQLGDDWIIPTLWHGVSLPQRPCWAGPFVVKARHGCRQNVFVRNGHEDWAAIRKTAARWMRRDYAGLWLDEWLYRHIPRGLLVEPFIGAAGALPVDYKFYVFAGRVEYIQVHLEREHAHRWKLFDRSWRQVSAHCGDMPLPPRNLTAMIEAAEQLGRRFDFVRVDLYDTLAGPRFGEMTFYPGSGLDPFDPPSLDAKIGAHWRRAQAVVSL